jgi:hypothetical protein
MLFIECYRRVNDCCYSACDTIDIPTPSTSTSICGLRILYHRYIMTINHMDPEKLPVRQKGWVNEAVDVK